MTPKPINKKAMDLAENLLYPKPNASPVPHSDSRKLAAVRHKSVGRSGAQKQSAQRQIVLNEQDAKLYIELTDQLCSIQEEDSHEIARSSTKDDSRKGTQPKKQVGKHLKMQSSILSNFNSPELRNDQNPKLAGLEEARSGRQQYRRQ